MAPVIGIYIGFELEGPVAERVRAIQAEFDPKLRAALPPHVTIVGSSGMGPIRRDVPVATLRERLEPIAATTPPMTLRFGRPMRFMQTHIISLPLDPHGPLRALHERIKTSGLPFDPPRFAFSPHATLNFFRELTPDTERRLLALRVTEPVRVERLTVTLSNEPFAPIRLLELTLAGAPARTSTDAVTRDAQDA